MSSAGRDARALCLNVVFGNFHSIEFPFFLLTFIATQHRIEGLQLSVSRDRPLLVARLPSRTFEGILSASL